MNSTQSTEKRSDKDIFRSLKESIPEADFASLILITQAFYQAAQDMEKSAQVICNALMKREFSFKGEIYPINPEQFQAFVPQTYEKELEMIMQVGHSVAQVRPRSLLFASAEEKKFQAVAMTEAVVRRGIQAYNRLLQEGKHGKRTSHSA